MPDQIGEIPVSAVLAEASAESISELFSRDPEKYTQQDLQRVVGALREQRARWVKAEAEGKTVKAKKTALPPGPQKPISGADLGLFGPKGGPGD